MCRSRSRAASPRSFARHSYADKRLAAQRVRRRLRVAALGRAGAPGISTFSGTERLDAGLAAGSERFPVEKPHSTGTLPRASRARSSSNEAFYRFACVVRHNVRGLTRFGKAELAAGR